MAIVDGKSILIVPLPAHWRNWEGTGKTREREGSTRLHNHHCLQLNAQQNISVLQVLWKSPGPSWGHERKLRTTRCLSGPRPPASTYCLDVRFFWGHTKRGSPRWRDGPRLLRALKVKINGLDVITSFKYSWEYINCFVKNSWAVS